MKVTVVGTGYVGLVTAVTLAHIKHDVICLDVDQNKINKLNKGISPIYEENIELLMKKNRKRLKDKLDKCRNIELSNVNLDDVDEISDIKICKRKSSNDRILDFLNEVKNPYVFKVKGKLVKIIFSDTNKTADDCLTDVLKNLYR